MSKNNERGAAAVEFAIILPLLMTLLLGIIEFGYLFNQQISLTQAAREGAREYAIHYMDVADGDFDFESVLMSSAPTLNAVNWEIVDPCGGVGDIAFVTATRTYSSFTGWFDVLSSKDLVGKGSMRCGG